MKIENKRHLIDLSSFGGKNYWTSFLLNEGYNVPRSFYFSIGSYDEYDLFTRTKEFVDFISSLEAKKYCVRSSGLSEDSDASSKAGKYLSVIGISKLNIRESLLKVIESGKGEKIGALLQEMIEPSFSGVIFSSNPLTKYKDEIVINYVEGFGEKLMSGQKEGVSLLINAKNVDLDNNSIKTQLEELITISKQLESKLGFPVDVEWCIEKNTNRLFILQCRPVTGILYDRNELLKVDENLSKYKDIVNNEKIKLRLIGLNNNIYVSPAYILRCNCGEEKLPNINIDFTPTDITTGYSVVVISPRVINGKIMRSFAGTHNKNAIKCNRYGIRLSTGTYQELVTCIQDMYQKLKDIVWSFTIIIQEVFDPYVTGIIKRSKKGYIMEILRGHFAAKGVFPMTKYASNERFDVVYRNEVQQDNYYLLINGSKVLLPNEDNDKTVRLSDDVVKNIFKKMSVLFDVKGLNIEFGVIKKEDYYLPYLIDYSIENEESVDLEQISNGVISSGRITAKLMKMDIGDTVGAIDTHFYNEVNNANIKYNNVIFVCELPSISLLNLLEEAGSNIGFVFKEGSALCHFAVTLRERGIPAIVGIDINTLDYQAIYTLDTDKPGDVKSKLHK